MRGRIEPLASHVRRVTFRMQTTDVRKYAVNETVRRARAAAERAGGHLLGGPRAPPVSTRRWCVLRSPHVNKKSREHFWMRIHRRDFDWDAPIGTVPDGVELEIAEGLPDNISIRVTVDAPALYRLRDIWTTLDKARAQRKGRSKAEDGEGPAPEGVAAALP
jgi:small subunit ribosomal protein S10